MAKTKKKIRNYTCEAEYGTSIKVGFIVGMILFFIPVFVGIVVKTETPQWLLNAAQGLARLLGQTQMDGSTFILISWGLFALLIFPILLAVAIIRFQKNAERVEIDSENGELRYYKGKKLVDSVDLSSFAVMEKASGKLVVLPSIADCLAGSTKTREIECKGIAKFDKMASDAMESSLGRSLRSDVADFLRNYLDTALSSKHGLTALVRYMVKTTEKAVSAWLDANGDAGWRSVYSKHTNNALGELCGYVSQQALDEYNRTVRVSTDVLALFITNKNYDASLLESFISAVPETLRNGAVRDIPEEVVAAFCEHIKKGSEYLADFISADMQKRGGRNVASLTAMRKFYENGMNIRYLADYVLTDAFANVEDSQLLESVLSFTEQMGVKPA